MYGFKQAAVLAYKKLVKDLSTQCYVTWKYFTGFWQYTTKKIIICLCVDDFCVKYFSETDADHILNTLLIFSQNIRGPQREELLWIDH